MKVTGGQLIVRALEEEDIRYGFGIPGTHNIELYDAMADAEQFTPILVTDEQSASFIADGYARASRQMAVVNVVPGAGLTHAMSGIAEAFLDGVPMLVLACGIRRDTNAAYQLHDVDQASMARPICKKVFQPKTHVEAYHAVREACHLARRTPSGPVLVEVPAHLYLLTQEVTEEELKFNKGTTTPPIDPARLARMASFIHESRNVGIYAGAGAQEARDLLIEFADHIDAIVFTTISGKGVFPEDHPRFAWNTLGATAPREIRALESELDCLIAIGCRFGEVATGSYGLTPPETLIHIDIDPKVFNKNFPAKETLQADAGEALKALLASPALGKKVSNLSRLAALAEAHQSVRQAQMESTQTTDQVSPFKLFTALQKHFGPDTIYVTDSGNGTFLAMEQLRLTRPRCFLAPVDYSCMGYSVPAAIGAKLGCPDRAVVALVGDGAFLMTGMEMLTAVNYSIAPVFCILRDGELSQIAQFQKAALNRTTCSTLAALNFEKMAQAVGLEYCKIQKNADLEESLEQARRTTSQNRPVMVEINIDYSESTYFSKGVVKTSFLRFAWKDRLRLLGRLIKRKMA